MGDALCLQPWISVSGNSNTVVQDEADWVEIVGHQDVAIYAEVAFVPSQAAVTNLEIQTAPAKDDALFGASISAVDYMASYGFSTSPPLGVQAITIVRWATVALPGPPSRWLRWRVIFGAADTTITFRLWLNLNRAARC